MTIAIQSTNAALAALESLAPQPSPPSGAQTGGRAQGVPAGLLNPSQPGQANSAGSDILSLSGGAAAALGGLTGGLSNAASAADAAVSAGSAIVALLGKLQAAAQSATNPALSPDQLAALNAGFKTNLAKVAETVAAASAGGLNLLDGSASGAPSQPTGGTASDLTGFNFSLGGPVIGLGPDAKLTDAPTAADIAGQLGQAIDNATQAVGQIAAQSQAINGHLAVVSQAALSLSPGVAGAVNSSLTGDGARLQALQIQQQLIGAGGAVANQAPQAILALFQ